MNKGENYQADFNADEKKDTMPHIRSKEVVKADHKHSAYRPRMNAIYAKDKK
jgi:ethanolamine utilization cobalamin adenosyltransferase